MNNLDYMDDNLPLYRIGNNKTIFLNSANAIKNGNEYVFNIRNMNIYKPSKLSLNTFIFNNTSNYNNFNEIKIKGININPQSYINSDFNGNPTIGSIVFDNNNLPSSYLTPTLITGITPTQIDNDIIYILPSSLTSYTLNLPYDTISDLLLIGSGGYGGTNAYSGGGGAGELIYINNYPLSAGDYTIDIKSYLGYTPTDVRQYPPKTYTSLSARSGTGPYYKTMTLDSSGITYGSGDYIVGYSSAYYNGSYEGDICFDRQITTTQYFLTLDNLYNINTGLYTGSRYLASSDYKGEWVYIKLPVAIYLCYYNIVSPGSTNAPRAPSLFKIYGSNDGINWEEITQASNDTNALTTNEYPYYFGIGYSSTTTTIPRYKKILSTPSKSYQYFGMVINKIISNNSLKAPGIMEWELFGFEDAYSNAIPKLNILSHYRDIIPKVYTSVADLGTTTQNGSTNYRWSLTLDSSGVEINETGTYEITCTGSAGYTTSHPYNILARTTNASTFTCNTTASYSSGVYGGSRYLESASYKGEWFYVKLPTIRLLYGFSIMIGSQLDNIMGEWKFYGSMSGLDGSWVEISDGSQSSRLAKTDYVQNGSYYYYSKYFTNPSNYLYYGFCCNKLTTTGTTTITWGNELYLLTKDILTITDKPNNNNGDTIITKDNNQILKAKAGGNGGWLFNTNTNVLPTSGGSGGGGYYKRFLNSVICYYLFNTTNLGLDGLNTYNLTNVSSVVQNTTDKRFGVSSAQFSGSNYLSIVNTGQFTPDILTISGWFKGTTGGSGVYQTICACRPFVETIGWLIYILPTSGYLSIWTGTGSTWAQTSTTMTLGDSLWHHFVVSIDRTAQTHKIWIDNVLNRSLTGKAYSANNIDYFTIGTISNGGVRLLNGSLVDSLYLFNRELTTDEINYLYTTGDYVIQSSATAGSPFNNIYTTGQVANGNNGTTTQGGSGGNINYNSSITGSSINYAVGGTGATDVSTPVSKTAYGEGGDGNSGNPSGGVCILRMKNIIDYNVFKYINNSGIEIEPQNISQLTIFNPNVNNTNLNFNMILDIEEIED